MKVQVKNQKMSQTSVGITKEILQRVMKSKASTEVSGPTLLYQRRPKRSGPCDVILPGIDFI